MGRGTDLWLAWTVSTTEQRLRISARNVGGFHLHYLSPYTATKAGVIRYFSNVLLEEEVRVVRGRIGRYEVVDFVLLLNSYALSGEKTLAQFFKALAPVREVLMSV